MSKTKIQASINALERQKEMDATIKSSFDAIVSLVSRKMEHKKPKGSAPESDQQFYGDLERSFKTLCKIAKNPAKYFVNDYKDSVHGDLLEASRLTGLRFNRLLDSLMALSIRYYRGKDTNKEKLETEIEKLHRIIKYKAARGLVQSLGILLTPAEKLVVREK
ncbi:MAG: hypothetical protein J5679_03585 [Alphaproteobacteria bacterium]|nr:hypothetical protein [Alphaproteobacteria bacterium]